MDPNFISSMVAAVVFAVALVVLNRRSRGIGSTSVQQRWLTLIIIFVVLAVIVTFGLIIFSIQGRGGVVSFLIMTLGALSKWVWDAIKNSDANGMPSFKPWELVLPILVSPIVYGVILSGIAELKPGPTPTFAQQFAPFVLTFQNGFCWQTVFDQATKKE